MLRYIGPETKAGWGLTASLPRDLRRKPNPIKSDDFGESELLGITS